MFYSNWRVQKTCFLISCFLSFASATIIGSMILETSAFYFSIALIALLIFCVLLNLLLGERLEKKYPLLFTSTVDKITYHFAGNNLPAIELSGIAGDVKFYHLAIYNEIKYFLLVNQVEVEFRPDDQLRIFATIEYSLLRMKLSDLIFKYRDQEGLQKEMERVVKVALKLAWDSVLSSMHKDTQLNLELTKAINGISSRKINGILAVCVVNEIQDPLVRIERTTTKIVRQ